MTTFKAADLRKLFGLSAPHIQYLVSEVIPLDSPTNVGRGRPRTYTYAEAFQFGVAACLRSLRIEYPFARSIIKLLREELGPNGVPELDHTMAWLPAYIPFEPAPPRHLEFWLVLRQNSISAKQLLLSYRAALGTGTPIDSPCLYSVTDTEFRRRSEPDGRDRGTQRRSDAHTMATAAVHLTWINRQLDRHGLTSNP